jgi:hypothetical protein
MSDTPEWPPVILFDAVYAAAVRYHFGTQALQDEATVPWKDSFYPDCIMNVAQADYKALSDKRAAAAEKSDKHNRERDMRHEGHHPSDALTCS